MDIRDKKTEKLAKELNLNYISTVDTAFLDETNVELPYELKHIYSGNKYHSILHLTI